MRPVPRETFGRLSPISFAESPIVLAAPWPSCPYPPYPQHFTLPSSRRAQVCSSPATTCSAVRPAPSSTTSKLSPISFAPSPTSFELPLPSLPLEPQPQHLIPPVSSLAQVWALPVHTSTAVRPVPRFTVGRWSPISLVLSPMSFLWPNPSCPLPLSPQHCRVPSSSLAQV